MTVPFIALRRGEVLPTEFALGFDPTLGKFKPIYLDEKPGDRDQHGILWLREGQDLDAEPIYDQVNGHRQAICMIARLCQVCAAPVAKPTDFIMPGSQMHPLLMTEMTQTPPVCPACIDEVKEECPALRRLGYIHFQSTDWSDVGVYGESAYTTPAHEVVRNPAAEARYDDPDVTLMIAKGVLAHIRSLEIVDQRRPGE